MNVQNTNEYDETIVLIDDSTTNEDLSLCDTKRTIKNNVLHVMIANYIAYMQRKNYIKEQLRLARENNLKHERNEQNGKDLTDRS